MPWLLDGSNLARGGDRERVRRAALAVARGERVRLVLFFDGPPPAGGEAVERLGRLEVRYVRDADAAILAQLGGDGRGWLVATDDRALAAGAAALGARSVGADEFRRKAARYAGATPAAAAAGADVEAELAYFGDPANRLADPESGARRRPRRRSTR